MGFADKPFNERMSTMGDKAESAFEAWAGRQDIRFMRTGINRPPFNNVFGIPVEIRATPDYLCERTVEEKGRLRNRLFYVECKGTSGKVLRLKLDALHRLREFFVDFEYKPFGSRKNPYHVPVNFFVYDSVNRRIALVSFEDMETWAKESPIEKFNDDNEYYAIDVAHFLWEKEPEYDSIGY